MTNSLDQYNWNPEQHDWREESKLADESTLTHVLQAHLENAVHIDAVLRLNPREVAEILLRLREDFHRESEMDFKESLEQDLRIKELEREVAWLRSGGPLFPLRNCPSQHDLKDISKFLDSKPPADWKP